MASRPLQCVYGIITCCALCLLLCVLFTCEACDAQPTIDYYYNGSYTNSSIEVEVPVPVPCPTDTLTEFTALTEMVFEGRTKWFNGQERSRLDEEFRGIYNGLTTTNCDAYFRKLVNLQFIGMVNSNGGKFNLTAASQRQRRGSQQQPQYEGGRYLRLATTSRNVNETESPPSVAITYNVTGTCRNCPTNRGGFELYDDTFRRSLLISPNDEEPSQHGLLLSSATRIRTKILHVRHLEGISVFDSDLEEDENYYFNDEDCVCLPGKEPLEPRAPGLQECIDQMNDKFEDIRTNNETDPQTGEVLFENVTLADLVQLDVDKAEDAEEEYEITWSKSHNPEYDDIV